MPDHASIVSRIIGGLIVMMICGAILSSIWNGFLAAAGAR
jgi:hypothetical protein